MGPKIPCKSNHQRKRPRPQACPFSSFASSPTPYLSNGLDCIALTSKKEDPHQSELNRPKRQMKRKNNMFVVPSMPIMMVVVVVSALTLLAGPSMASTPTASRHLYYRSTGLHSKAKYHTKDNDIESKTRIKRSRSSTPPTSTTSTTLANPNAQNGNSDQKAERMAEIRRRAAKGTKSNGGSGSGGKGSNAGCQVLTCDEMESAWIFPSDMPPCPGHVHKYSYEDDACEAWKSSGKGGGKGKGGGGGENGSGKGSDGNNNYSGGAGGAGDGGNGGGDTDTGGGDNSSGGGGSSGGSGGGADDNNDNGDGGGNNDNRGDGNGDGGGEGAVDGGEGDGNDDAMANFDITVCESYSSIWLWDLALTCASTESLDGCDCLTAENLRSSGVLVCPEDGGGYSCPTDCPVCRTCLSLLGCASLGEIPSVVVSADMAEAVPYAVAAVVAVAFVALLIYREKRRQDTIGYFGSDGIDKDPNELGEFPTPYVAAPVYGETGPLVSESDQGTSVWLAPVD